MTRDQRQERRRDASDVFIRVGRGISAGMESRHLLDIALDGLLEITGADRGVITTLPSGERPGECCAREVGCDSGRGVPPGIADLLKRTLHEDVPLLIREPESLSHLAAGRTEDPPGIALCHPLRRGRSTFGSIYLEADAPRRFDAGTMQIVAGVADLLNLALAQSQRQEDELRAICDTVRTALLVVDVHGIIQSVNRAACDLIGVADRHELVGRDVTEALRAGKEDLTSAMSVALRTGRRASAAFMDRAGEEGQRFLALDVSIMPEQGADVRMLVALEDRTERQQVLTEAAQREKMAAIGFLAAGVAHEFNNIWSAVYGYAELAESDPSFREELAKVTLEQAERAAEIIQSLLSFSSKKLEVRQDVPLDDLLRGVAQLIVMELRAKSIELDLDLEEGIAIGCSPGQLQQVFLNLVINATHAIGERGRIRISLARENSMAVVRVEDDGKGMTPEELEQIFVPFYTTKGSLGGDKVADGHGLGLTLTYNIIRSHHGTIHAESTPGEGSVFTVAIPAQDASRQRATSSTPRSTSPPRSLCEGRKYLVVDDEVLLHGLIRAMLGANTVDAVESGEEALELLNQTEYDAIFLDLVLAREITGFDLFEELKQKHPDLPIIVITGRPKDARLEQYLQDTVCVIEKPFTMQEVRAAAEAALQQAGKLGSE